MKRLSEIIRNGEDWLMARILEYAIRHDYAQYTSTLTEPWRLSISGLSASLLSALPDDDEGPMELEAERDYRGDPAATFGIEEARRHRERGVDIGMFLGLLKYYRESYLDLLTEAAPPDVARYRHWVHRFFDRLEIGLCSEWSRGTDAERIWELQETNRRMTNEKNKFLTLFESLASPVLLLSPDRRVDHLNRAAADLFDVNANRYYTAPSETAVEKTNAKPRGTPVDRLLPDLDPEIQRVADRKTGFREFDYRLHAPDGIRHFQARLSAMQDVSGKFDGFLLILNDETRLKQTQDRLREARDVAESANRAKSEFLANMSHELRTPLNAILGFSQLLSGRSGLAREDREHLEIIRRSGEHLLTLINQVLDLTKIEAGRMGVQSVSFDLRGLLTDMRELFRLKAREKGLQLILDLDPTVPPFVEADDVKLRQVIINLLGNAVKFTDKGRVALRAWAGPGPEPMLTLEVSDTGIGISADELDLVFQSFAQGERRDPSREGTGLGLGIARKFVHLMGGDIFVESEPGRGTCFRVQLPVRVCAPGTTCPVPPGRYPERLASGQPSYRILVVDDNPENRTLMRSILEPLGFEIQEAADGAEAVSVWASWDPQLIWMDMRMPVMNGFEAVARIKSTTRGQAAAVIAMTASVFEDEREVVLSQGCDDYLRKPFRVASVFELLEKHLGVQFRYPETVLAADCIPRPSSETELTPHLERLPEAHLHALREAIEAVDPDRIETLLSEIGKMNGDVAGRISDELAEFRYDAVLTAIAGVIGPKQKVSA